jgi:hypothetical protein
LFPAAHATSPRADATATSMIFGRHQVVRRPGWHVTSVRTDSLISDPFASSSGRRAGSTAPAVARLGLGAVLAEAAGAGVVDAVEAGAAIVRSTVWDPRWTWSAWLDAPRARRKTRHEEHVALVAEVRTRRHVAVRRAPPAAINDGLPFEICHLDELGTASEVVCRTGSYCLVRAREQPAVGRADARTRGRHHRSEDHPCPQRPVEGLPRPSAACKKAGIHACQITWRARGRQRAERLRHA